MNDLPVCAKAASCVGRAPPRAEVLSVASPPALVCHSSAMESKSERKRLRPAGVTPSSVPNIVCRARFA